jgi:hypothetical protein
MRAEALAPAGRDLAPLSYEEWERIMTIRYASRALTAALLFGGVAALGSVQVAAGPGMRRTHAPAQDTSALPKGHMTLVGCFLRMADPHDTDDMRYVLANPTAGPATTVPDANCAATGNEQILRLSDLHKTQINSVTLGRWVEIYGELGKVRDADDLRKFEVKSIREVPVMRRVAIARPAPEPPRLEAPAPAPEEQAVIVETPAPVATTGVEPQAAKKLPHTASPLPLIAILGLFALSGGLVLSLFDRRQALGRG